MRTAPMCAYRILALDGGGIRGMLTAVLLERLIEDDPGLLEKVDLFAGTSTGGLMALGFAAGWTPTQARALYAERGAFVFADSHQDDLRDLGNAVGAQYGVENVRSVLVELFGDLRLGDLPKKILISSFDLDNASPGWRPGQGGSSLPTSSRTWKPKFFHNFPGVDSDAHERVVDVALRTSAAPSYFPIYQGYIDGGVVASNPAMCALAQALDPATGGQSLVNLALLSIGTGRFPRYLTSQDGDWGWVQWARPLIDIIMEGMEDVAHYQCSRVMGRRYHRLDPDLPEPISLDRTDSLPELTRLAMAVRLDKTREWLRRYFR